MLEKRYIQFTSIHTDLASAIGEVCDALKPLRREVVKLTAYVDAPDESSYAAYIQHLSVGFEHLFGAFLPTYSVLAQKPENACLVVVALLSDAPKQYLSLEGLPYVVLEDGDVRELWVSGMGCANGTSVVEASHRAFEQMQQILEKEKMSMEQVVRQWNYIGDILRINAGNIQNYQAFNDLRNNFYSKHLSGCCFPAATGIGMRASGVIIDFFAREKKAQEIGFPLRSAVQANPFAYSQSVLVGKPLQEGTKKAPLFERARLLAEDDEMHIFVSGTASIRDQETVAEGDIEAQTHNTIACIEELLKPSNWPEECASWDPNGLVYRRVQVYVKNRDNFPVVSLLCRMFYPDALVCLVEADICRDNLLVEIEADLQM